VTDPGRRPPSQAEGFTLGATGILDCLEFDDGRLVWTHDVLRETGGRNPTWGKSASPLVTDALVVVTGGDGGSTLVAYKRATGELAWHSGGDEPSYASPALTSIAGKLQILSMNHHNVTGHDPATGNILWSYDWPGPSVKWPVASQPLVVGIDQIFLSAGYNSGCVMLKLTPTSGALSASEVWRGKSLKTQFNNVSIRDGFLYGLDEGLLACVDIGTGRRVWKDGRFGSGQSLLVDDLLIVQGETGAVALVEASPAGYHEVGRIEKALPSKTWNNPALATPYLLIRNDQEAACYELPVLGAAVAPGH
jgi:outer membrane protein assembly factor BamB